MPNVSPIDTIAAQFKQIAQRLASLERVAGAGSGDSGIPAGVIASTVAATAPDGWLMIDGQTITNGQTEYPDLWAAIPASWKSGSNIVFPSDDDVVFMGGGTLGAAGGANTHTLVAGNLPPHAHTINHDHAAATSGPNSGDHTHAINHDHASFSTAPGGAHIHNARFLTTATGSGSNADLARPYNASSSFEERINVTGESGALHSHTIDVPAFTGTSGGESATHTHSVDLPNFTGNSGNGPGASTAVDHTPKHIRVRFIIKT